MPFKSENQRKFMFSKHPDIAREWAHEYMEKKHKKGKKKMMMGGGMMKGGMGGGHGH